MSKSRRCRERETRPVATRAKTHTRRATAQPRTEARQAPKQTPRFAPARESTPRTHAMRDSSSRNEPRDAPRRPEGDGGASRAPKESIKPPTQTRRRETPPRTRCDRQVVNRHVWDRGVSIVSREGLQSRQAFQCRLTCSVALDTPRRQTIATAPTPEKTGRWLHAPARHARFFVTHQRRNNSARRH